MALGGGGVVADIDATLTVNCSNRDMSNVIQGAVRWQTVDHQGHSMWGRKDSAISSQELLARDMLEDNFSEKMIYTGLTNLQL